MQPLGLKNHPFSVILGSSRNVQLVLSHLHVLPLLGHRQISKITDLWYQQNAFASRKRQI